MSRGRRAIKEMLRVLVVEKATLTESIRRLFEAVLIGLKERAMVGAKLGEDGAVMARKSFLRSMDVWRNSTKDRARPSLLLDAALEAVVKSDESLFVILRPDNAIHEKW